MFPGWTEECLEKKGWLSMSRLQLPGRHTMTAAARVRGGISMSILNRLRCNLGIRSLFEG
jgi:hypothetical protein